MAIDYFFGPEFASPDAENALVLGFVELSRTMPKSPEVLTTAYSATRVPLVDSCNSRNPRSAPRSAM
ncbi:hypothetical protein ASF88_01815 [Leifsonia sp. Leaf336]|uniref:hypothetical protein n=1 Tax=Leifsonia sp. Leaf336 TaxID=1736341 RepID=UPI0006FEC447|nr:hypothetical protein [Leifsonia sp. Leaf336]KQR53625.1 hypothetical protein ASF88_01815 [Leifsonia sp. Leaf336]